MTKETTKICEASGCSELGTKDFYRFDSGELERKNNRGGIFPVREIKEYLCESHFEQYTTEFGKSSGA